MPAITKELPELTTEQFDEQSIAIAEKLVVAIKGSDQSFVRADVMHDAFARVLSALFRMVPDEEVRRGMLEDFIAVLSANSLRNCDCPDCNPTSQTDTLQ